MQNLGNILKNSFTVSFHLKRCEDFFSQPNDLAARLYENGSCMKNLGARALSIAQIIVSIVAVPLALLAMIFVPAITLFTHDKMVARQYAIGLGGLTAGHLFRIPESFVGVIFPSTISKSVDKEIIQAIGEGAINQCGGLMRQMGGFLQQIGQQNR